MNCKRACGSAPRTACSFANSASVIASSHQAEARRKRSPSSVVGMKSEGIGLARRQLGGMRLLRDRAIHAAKQTLTNSGQTTVHRTEGAAKLFGYFCGFHA